MTRNEIIIAAGQIADKADKADNASLYCQAKTFENDMINEPTKSNRKNNITVYTVREGKAKLNRLKNLLKNIS